MHAFDGRPDLTSQTEDALLSKLILLCIINSQCIFWQMIVTSDKMAWMLKVKPHDSGTTCP